MKILIVTQVVASDHPILGFFHRWIEEFAAQCEQVTILCLERGEYNLPSNVTVHSLGKESGVTRLTYIWRFYQYCWRYRREYDSVFVHMNQIYVLLGALLWRSLSKRVGLWYMHGTTSFSLRIATWLTHDVFTGSPESFRVKSRKVLVTGHGIDTKRFSPQSGVVQDIDLITVGRITPSKNLEVLLETLVDLPPECTLTICGTAVTDAEEEYAGMLRQRADELGVADRVMWFGRVSQDELPELLRRSKLFVTAAQNGSLDKAVLEPMACSVPVVSMAPGTRSLPLGTAQVTTSTEFVEAVIAIWQSKVFERPGYVTYIQTEHSLQRLITKLITAYQS